MIIFFGRLIILPGHPGYCCMYGHGLGQFASFPSIIICHPTSYKGYCQNWGLCLLEFYKVCLRRKMLMTHRGRRGQETRRWRREPRRSRRRPRSRGESRTRTGRSSRWRSPLDTLDGGHFKYCLVELFDWIIIHTCVFLYFHQVSDMCWAFHVLKLLCFFSSVHVLHRKCRTF